MLLHLLNQQKHVLLPIILSNTDNCSASKTHTCKWQSLCNTVRGFCFLVFLFWFLVFVGCFKFDLTKSIAHCRVSCVIIMSDHVCMSNPVPTKWKIKPQHSIKFKTWRSRIWIDQMYFVVLLHLEPVCLIISGRPTVSGRSTRLDLTKSSFDLSFGGIQYEYVKTLSDDIGPR